jgi:MFS family permease
MFACDGVMSSVVPTIAIEIFGHSRGHEVYSYLFSNFGVMSLIAAFIVSVLLKYIGYKGVFMICFGSTLLSFVLAMTLNTKKRFDYLGHFKKTRTETIETEGSQK